MHKFNLYAKDFQVNGLDIGKAESIKENSGSIDINLKGREQIIIYAFSRSMFAIPSKRRGSEHFEFSGPRLGFYHDTADMREGPFVNHFLRKLSVHVRYHELQVIVEFSGAADLSCSHIDDYWYKGKKKGIWSFTGSAVYEYYE
jgi:hypothetical protein